MGPDARSQVSDLQRDFSAFLDLLRFSAAVLVFIVHLITVTGAPIAVSHVAHGSVIAFFVLSGYVISWSAARDGTALRYAISRAARIYTVAIPAIVLTIAIDIYLAHMPAHGGLPSVYELHKPVRYLALALSFTTDFWFLKEDAFSNAPFWSLCYEVWYYVMFGVALFGPRRWKIVCLVCLLALTGPRLWLLFPTWLGGVFVERLHRRAELSQTSAWLGLTAAFLLLLIVSLFGVETSMNGLANALTGGFLTTHMRYSQYVPGDYLTAVAIGGAIFFARYIRFRVLFRLQPYIHAAAGITFSMYLTHFPFLELFAYLFCNRVFYVGAASLICVTLFGVLIERKTSRVRSLMTALAAKIRAASWKTARA